MINLSQECEVLARRLAVAQGVPIEEAIRLALEDKIRAFGPLASAFPARDISPDAIAARRERTNKFVAELAALPLLDSRTPAEIMDDLDPL